MNTVSGYFPLINTTSANCRAYTTKQLILIAAIDLFILLFGIFEIIQIQIICFLHIEREHRHTHTQTYTYC